MKFILSVAAYSVLSVSAMATELTLSPGSQVRVVAGQDMTITCSGTTAAGETCECKVWKTGTENCSYGNFCYSITYKNLILASTYTYDDAATTLRSCRIALENLRKNGTCN